MLSDVRDVSRGTSPPSGGLAETDLAEWRTVVDAAAAIGCSKRTIERLAAARKIEQRLRPQAGSPAVAVYNPDDVARIASERRPAPQPFVLDAVRPENGNGHRKDSLIQTRPSGSSRLSGAIASDPAQQFFAHLLRMLQSPPSPPVEREVADMAETLSPEERAAQYVTLPQASAIKGLTETRLRRLIKAGTLTAIRDRGWRIRRRDLEAL